MNTEQFLSDLREALNGSVSPASVNEHVRYYEEYIDTEKRKGRSEEEIMEELGDPRLIARTIIDTTDISDRRGAEKVIDADGGYEEGPGNGDYRGRVKYTRVSGWKALAVLAVILIVFFAILTLAAFLVGSFILAFWPVILVAGALWWILNPFRGDL